MGAWEEAPLGLDLVLRDMWVMLVVGLDQMILEGFSNLHDSMTLQRGWQAPKMKNAGRACKGWLGRMYIMRGLSWRPFRKAGKVKVMLGVFLFFPITDPSCSRASRQGLAEPTCTSSREPAVWHQLLLFLLGWTWLRPLFFARALKSRNLRSRGLVPVRFIPGSSSLIHRLRTHCIQRKE